MSIASATVRNTGGIDGFVTEADVANGEHLALLVESDAQLRESLSGFMASEGWRVVGLELLSHARIEVTTQRADLVILSAEMPDGDSLEFIRDVRSWSAVPILLLCESNAEHVKVSAFEAGADDFLGRPFGVREFLARARAQVRRWRLCAASAQSVSTMFTFGDVVIDRQARTVRKRGVDVHLTRTEYRLLTVLATNVNRVLTHNFLFREVWGSAAPRKNHNVRLHMRNLRLKLEDFPQHPAYLRTEPSVGYRLVVEPTDSGK